MRNIVIEKGDFTPMEKRQIEIVERKGVGHPDTLIDGIMEEISIELSKAYIEKFGKILHHNVDKGQICGGGTQVEYGGGEFIKPVYILLSGRATMEAEGKLVPMTAIALKTAKRYIKEHVRFLDLESDVIVDSRIAPGSKDLVDVFLRGPKIPFANDTSFGVGYAPLSELEVICMKAENMLNSPDYKKKMPGVGEDIKVMGLRDGDKIRLTVAIAFVSRFVKNLDDYLKQKERVNADILACAKKYTKRDVEVFVNTADDVKNGSVYITLTGLSLEMGDDGSVGRGNRVNGLITPCRPMTLEAVAGKNPVNHVGKIYSLGGFEIANSVVKQYPDIAELNITLLSQIGKPIDQPKSAAVQLLVKDGANFENLKGKVAYAVDAELEHITDITEKIINRKLRVV